MKNEEVAATIVAKLLRVCSRARFDASAGDTVAIANTLAEAESYLENRNRPTIEKEVSDDDGESSPRD